MCMILGLLNPLDHDMCMIPGLLNPLDTVHHVRLHDDAPYREGVVLKKPVRGDKGSYVNVGLGKELLIGRQLKPGVRVTVKMGVGSKGKCINHHLTLNLLTANSSREFGDK